MQKGYVHKIMLSIVRTREYTWKITFIKRLGTSEHALWVSFISEKKSNSSWRIWKFSWRCWKWYHTMLHGTLPLNKIKFQLPYIPKTSKHNNIWDSDENSVNILRIMLYDRRAFTQESSEKTNLKIMEIICYMLHILSSCIPRLC